MSEVFRINIEELVFPSWIHLKLVKSNVPRATPLQLRYSFLAFPLPFFGQKPEKKAIIVVQSRNNLMITCRILFFWRGGIPDLWWNIDLFKCKRDPSLKTLQLVLNFITVAKLSMCLSGCRVRTIKCHSLYSHESAFCLLHLINIKRWNSVPTGVSGKLSLISAEPGFCTRNPPHCH